MNFTLCVLYVYFPPFFEHKFQFLLGKVALHSYHLYHPTIVAVFLLFPIMRCHITKKLYLQKPAAYRST